MKSRDSPHLLTDGPRAVTLGRQSVSVGVSARPRPNTSVQCSVVYSGYGRGGLGRLGTIVCGPRYRPRTIREHRKKIAGKENCSNMPKRCLESSPGVVTAENARLYPTFIRAGVLCDCLSRTRDLCSGLAFSAVTTPGLDSQLLLAGTPFFPLSSSFCFLFLYIRIPPSPDEEDRFQSSKRCVEPFRTYDDDKCPESCFPLNPSIVNKKL
ncbi:hypothetical protein J6590_015973 [Homalodisca vitripennis]|nr:hypothetical protein J6590_015973 [Homalodisca vitripennis]